MSIPYPRWMYAKHLLGDTTGPRPIVSPGSVPPTLGVEFGVGAERRDSPAFILGGSVGLRLGLGLDVAPGEAVSASAGPAPDLSVALQSDGSCSLSIPVAAGNFTPWVNNSWTIIDWTIRGTSGTGTTGGPGHVVSSGDVTSGWKPGVSAAFGTAYLFLTTAPGSDAVEAVLGAGGQIVTHDAAGRLWRARPLTSTIGYGSSQSHVAPSSATPAHHYLHRSKAYGYQFVGAGALWWRREIYTRVLSDAEVTAIVITHPDLHPIDAAAAEGLDVSDALAHIYQAADRYDSGGGVMKVPDQWGTGGDATLLAGTSARFISSAWPY